MDAPTNFPVDQTGDHEGDTPANGEQQESDWEYEYDENVTEDFYVTLDLTSHAPSLPTTQKRNLNSDDTPGFQDPTEELYDDPLTPQRATAAVQATPQSGATVQTPEAQRSRHPTTPKTQSREQGQSNGDIHITDFASETPALVFNGNIYTCNWATALGTDLIFSAEPPGSDPVSHPPQLGSSTPLRQTKGYTLHAATPLRLIAKPAQVVPRSDAASTHQQEHHKRAQAGPSKPSSRTIKALTSEKAKRGPQEEDARARKRRHAAQTDFLTRLNAAALERGVSGTLAPLYAARPNHQPAGVTGGFGLGDGTDVSAYMPPTWRVQRRGDQSPVEYGEEVDGDEDDEENEDDDIVANVSEGGEGEQEEDGGGTAVEKPLERKNRLRRARRWRKRVSAAQAVLGSDAGRANDPDDDFDGDVDEIGDDEGEEEEEYVDGLESDEDEDEGEDENDAQDD